MFPKTAPINSTSTGENTPGQALATLAGPLGSSQEVLGLGTSSPACESSAALVPELLSTADAEGEFPSVS